eukprot:c20619_g1_i4.p1 GENE.c20619_g1_i4~~c20619_g1_i4.p1  ORF type:complete len:486 (+),score=117.48 c20619_g1_i4:406-1863(+)
MTRTTGSKTSIVGWIRAKSDNNGIEPKDGEWPTERQLAERLTIEGWPVPGFLLYHGDPRYVRPLVALSVLTKMIESSGEKVTLEPYVYCEPNDPRYVPPYVAALERQRLLWSLQHLHPKPRSQTLRRVGRIASLVWTPFQYIIGTIISLVAIVITFYAIQKKLYAQDAPPVVMGIALVVLLIVIAYSEGYHVTIITLEKVDANAFKDTHPRAYSAHMIANKNAECFVVGRQVLLTAIVFCVALVTDFSNAKIEEDWLFFPAKFMQGFMQSGVPVALIVLAFGQLLPQLIATAYPIHHMNLPLGFILIRLMLLADWIGIANVGFWGAKYWRQMAGILVNEEFGVGGNVVFGVGADGKDKVGIVSDLEDGDKNGNVVVTHGSTKQAELNTGAHIGGEASGEISKRVRWVPIEVIKMLCSGGVALGTFAMTLKFIITSDKDSKLGTFFGAPWPVTILIHIILLIGMLVEHTIDSHFVLAPARLCIFLH